jgi:hypothetical protein
MSQHARSRSRAWGIAGAIVLLSAISAAATVWRSSGSSAPSIAPVGSIYQSNIVVGFGSGAKFDPADRTRIEFSEIGNARRLDLRQPFEFEKHILKISRVHYVRDQPGDTSPGSRTLQGVVAQVIGKRQ